MNCAEFQRDLPFIIDEGGNAEQEQHLKECKVCADLVHLYELLRDHLDRSWEIDFQQPPIEVSFDRCLLFQIGDCRRQIRALMLAESIDRVNLERAIESLPPGYRIIFVLHDIEGYEHNEIAEMMGCSIGNSKSQLHKARMKLRELLRTGERKESAV